eukprot:SAG31_NODE_7915_length_1566_cov_1.241990_2_plen_78_part_00
MVELLRELMTSLGAGQECVYMGGNGCVDQAEVHHAVLTFIATLPQKLRERWQARCKSSGNEPPECAPRDEKRNVMCM